MLKSKTIQRLLHLLVVLVGAGLGVAVTLGGLQIYRWLRPADPLSLLSLGTAYILMGLTGAAVFHLLSPRILKGMADLTSAMERYLDKLSTAQLVTGSCGLVGGMLIAALLSQLLTFMGASIFTTAISGILYVVLGITGFSVGRRRSGDLFSLKDKALPRSVRRKGKAADETSPPRPKALDASTLIDGRILEVCRLGFMEGELIIPEAVLEELRRLADSADPSRRIRGRRGLDMVQKLLEDSSVILHTEETVGVEDAEAAVLRIAREQDAAVISGDTSLCRLARASGMTALNLNELAAALRTVVHAGDSMIVQIVKEGKEPGQGVGYLPDGTMIVVEGGREYMGKNAEVTVTSALQTSAGRMIFAKAQANDSNA